MLTFELLSLPLNQHFFYLFSNLLILNLGDSPTMDIRISSEGINISPKSKLKIQKKIGTKVEKLLAHLSQDLKTGHLRIEKLKYRQYKANFEMLLPGKNGRIVAQNINHQLLTTVTGLREIIERQITKYKNLTFNPKKKNQNNKLN